MKNLKKVLSLALAFAMVLGLCVGAMAATPDVTTLKDWADVTHKEAAQLLNAFNIMGGDDKGFRPADNVTRAEAVKMISVALWRGEDLKDLFKDGATTFTDVSSTDWFAGYVKYAATAEIIAGRNATTFDPKGNVTGYELLKMTLTALGYRQADEGLTGAGWQTRAMILAMDKKLTTGVKITDWSKPINREDSAQVIANMITAIIVKYDRDGYVIESTADDPIPTFGAMYLGLTPKDGTLVANAYGTTTHKDASGADVAYTADSTKGNSAVLIDGETTATTVTTNSTLLDLGTPVTLFYKGTKLVSVVVDGWTEVAPTYNASYTAITNYSKDATGADNHKTIVHGVKASDCYAKTTYIDTNADGNIDVETTVYYNTVKEVKAVNETAKNGSVYQIGDNPWRDSYDVQGFDLASRNFINGDNIGAKKGDYIAYVGIKNAVGGTVYQGVILTPVTGNVTRVSTNAYGESVYHIDGDEGHTAAAAAANITGLGFNASGTFYLDPDDSIGFYKGTAAESKVAFLYDAGYVATGAGTAMGSSAGTATLTVAAILPDGSKGTYTVASVPGTTTALKANSYANVTSILGAQGYLANLNNLNSEAYTVSKNDRQQNYLVTYYIDTDGNMVITGKVGVGTDKTATKAANVTADVVAGVTAKIGNSLITSSTVTFVQTKETTFDENGALKTAEDWTVAIGNTVSYSNKQSENIDVYTAPYTSGTSYVKYVVADAKTTSISTTKTALAFYYIVANNGQVGGTTEAPIYEVVYFDADANEVKTVKSTTNAVAGTFYTKMTDNTWADADKLTTVLNNTNSNNKMGYVTGLQDNILALTEVTEVPAGETKPAEATPSVKKTATDTFFKEVTNAYVTNKDTKFYTINGDKSTAITASDVILQGAVEPTVSQNKASTTVTVPTISVTVKYGAIVVTNDSGVATTVILFEKDQSFATQYYKDTTPATTSGR